MSSPMTTTTHVGPRVVQGHNIRDPRLIMKEKHIDLNGIHEIWLNKNIRKSYDEIFGEAVREYNEKQKDPRRKIDDYYMKIKKSSQQHPCYEMIVTIGNMKNQPPPEVGKEIMREFVNDWERRNPNLILMSVTYHADEPGANHIHIDFTPIAYKNSRGMKIQTSFNKALKEMGFENKNGKYHETEVIQWTNREREYLDELCRSRGIEVFHPQAGKGVVKHLEKEEYILTQKIKELNAKIEKAASASRYVSDAKDFFDAFNQLCIDKESDPEFTKFKKLLKEKIEYEKELEKVMSIKTGKDIDFNVDNKKDPMSIEYIY
ncbi:MAG: hypothetical protein E7555_02860 [Ruminococcaceae bacterium]|nr:hypothetical protein [Oscillospiraceae bacterium]